MANDKQKKKKERERRVAQKKLAEAAQKRVLEQTAKATQAGSLRPNKLASAVPVHKVDQSANVKSTFIRRRGVS